jgi:hypothetical protein
LIDVSASAAETLGGGGGSLLFVLNEASAATAARHLKRAGFKKIRPLLGGIEAWSQAGRPLEILHY